MPPSADPHRRFTDRVADYVRFRPRYPLAVLDVLRDTIGLAPTWTIADVGSGTGFSAELFLDHGNTVFAVEPNADMRAAAESLYGARAGFRSIAGSAEHTTLDAASVDLVVAGQAFHWFDATRARVEFARILRTPHRVVLLWNTRRTGASAFLGEYERLLETFGTDYQQVRHDRLNPAVLHAFFDRGFVRRTVPNHQDFDWTGLRGRLLSSSYTPAPDDPQRSAMLERLRELYDRHAHAGSVRFDYDTEIYIGG